MASVSLKVCGKRTRVDPKTKLCCLLASCQMGMRPLQRYSMHPSHCVTWGLRFKVTVVIGADQLAARDHLASELDTAAPDRGLVAACAC